MRDDSAKTTIGMTAPQLVASLPGFMPEIAWLTFMSYPVTPGFDERLQAAGSVSPEVVVRNAVVHDLGGRRTFRVLAQDVSEEKIRELHSEAGENRAIGITSVVETLDRKRRHIPMMDLKSRVSGFNQRAIVDLFKSVRNEPGVLLDSGNSYHYYGLQTVDESSWRAFLGECLLFSPVVDSRYVGHRLIDGFCVLRVSEAAHKSRVPAVVQAW